MTTHLFFDWNPDDYRVAPPEGKGRMFQQPNIFILVDFHVEQDLRCIISTDGNVGYQLFHRKSLRSTDKKVCPHKVGCCVRNRLPYLRQKVGEK